MPTKIRSLRAGAGLLALFLANSALASAPGELSGMWILYDAEEFQTPQPTGYGEARQAAYDFRSDDPSLLCIPASWTRVYSNPNTPIELSIDDTGIHFRYELFDLERHIPPSDIDSGSIVYQVNDPAYPSLGESAAWFDGEVLVIDTRNYHADHGVLSTSRQWAGVQQSDLLRTIERYWTEGDALHLEIVHIDPLMYQQPLTVNYRFTRDDTLEILPYGCQPENATVTTADQAPQSIEEQP